MLSLIKKALFLLDFFKELFLYYFLLPIAMVLYGKRKIYIVCERGTDARDNGYHFFRYMRTHHPEKEVYYIINKNSADLKKVEPYGNIVYRCSLKHYLMFIASKVKISTHIMGFSTNIGVYRYHRFTRFFKFYGKIISLKHGIIKDDLSYIYSGPTEPDMICCGARIECNYLLNNLGLKKHSARYTGLARYDALYNFETKKQILVMPTWRKGLGGTVKKVGDSEYVKNWNDLITDQKLLDVLSEKNIELIFYPHYNMQPYLECFKTTSKFVKIADFANYDVQQLLKESKLLVTDFSSVFFDFAYMIKPSIYFQFDAKEFFDIHYKKGYFDYEDMGFGEVVCDKREAADAIIKCIKNDFILEDKYKQRINNFFTIRDTNNCKRIYEEIEKLTKG